MAFPEPAALAEVLEDVEPSAPTACAGWTAHDVVAHLQGEGALGAGAPSSGGGDELPSEQLA